MSIPLGGAARTMTGAVVIQEVILQWASEGMGNRAISSKLRNELGLDVSYKTVQRALCGEREA
jgi:hypothetical protein